MKKQEFIRLFQLVLFLFCSVPFFAQQTIQFTGIVKDKDNEETLIGANVVNAQDKTGTITNEKGEFSLKVTRGSKINITYLGYNPIQIIANTTTKQIIYLQQESTMLNELVVVGYGTQKKASLSGSLGVAGKEIFADKSTSNSVTALQGRIPGLNITKTQGKPGNEGWRMNIRGLSTAGDLAPLVIVDGQTMANSEELMKMNSNDIENVTVLKDGAASIYGSRAAGGVILITTKKAGTSKATLAYNGNVTLETLGRNVRFMDRKEWYNNLDMAYANAGLADSHPFFLLKEYYLGDASNYAIQRDDPRFTGMASFQDVTDFTFCDTDWRDVFFGNGLSTQHNLSLSGSSEKTNYYVSFGYSNQGSPLEWGDLSDKRYSARMNLETKLFPGLVSKTRMSYDREYYIEPTATGNAISNIRRRQPGMAYQTVDGKPYAWGAQPAENWAMEYGGDYKKTLSRTNISQSFEYTPIKDLTIVGLAGFNDWSARDKKLVQPVTYYDYNGTKEVLTTPKLADTEISASENSHFYQNYQLYATYQKVFAKLHDFKIMLGTSYENERYEGTWTKRKEISVNDMYSLNMGDAKLTTNGDNIWQWAIGSYFGRLNYGYDGKYIVEGNFRYDGISKFTPTKRWGFFGGVSGAWRISEENFMKNTNVFQNLKLRASYGTTGNGESAGIYDYVQRMWLGTYPFGEEQDRYQTMGTNGMVSLDRTWETLKSTNFGLDFSTLNSRLSGTIDYFMKNNDNMLVGVTYPSILGAGAPKTNSGSMETKGYEISLSWQDKIGKDFRYNVSVSFSDAKNIMTNLQGEGEVRQWVISYKQGYSAYTFFGYKSDGIIQNEEQLANYKLRFKNLPSDINVGDAMYTDKNGDNQLTSSDLYDLGSADPRYAYSANLGFDWKGIDFSAFFQGYGKIMGYSWDDRPFINWYTNNNSYFIGKVAQIINDPNDPTKKIVSNSDARFPKVTSIQNISSYNYQLSDIMLRDYGYLRLKNITLGYTLPQSITKKAKITKLRVYVSGQDIWEWVKTDDGNDPERDWRDVNSSNFPSMRSWSFGVNVVF